MRYLRSVWLLPAARTDTYLFRRESTARHPYHLSRSVSRADRSVRPDNSSHSPFRHTFRSTRRDFFTDPSAPLSQRHLNLLTQKWSCRHLPRYKESRFNLIKCPKTSFAIAARSHFVTITTCKNTVTEKNHAWPRRSRSWSCQNGSANHVTRHFRVVAT